MKTTELKEAMNTIYKHINPRKTSESMMHSFIFNNNKLIGLNENYSVEYPFESEIQVIVPAEEMMKIISGIEEDSIFLKPKENSLLIKTKGIKSEISCYEWREEEILVYLETPKKKWGKVPGTFNQGLKLCLFSASRDSLSGFFNSICIKDTYIQSTDNFRISRFDMKESMPYFLLPLFCAIPLSDKKTSNYILEENSVHFKNEDGTIFHSKIIVGEDFPSIEELFKINKKNKIIIPKELYKSVSMVSVLAEGDFLVDKKITVEIKDGKIYCKAKNETGWIESETKSESKKDMSFSINPIFFLEILKLSSEAYSDDSKIVFETENFLHLVTLIS